jgi:hypothetical protein
MSERAAMDEAPIAPALEAMIAYDGANRTETLEIPQVIQLRPKRDLTGLVAQAPV